MQKMIQLNVTKLDIQRGNKKQANTCPVARALRRALKIKRANNKDNTIRVLGYTIVVGDKHKTCYFNDRTSKKRTYNLRKFVQAFDAGLPVEPCKLFLVRD